MNSVEQIRKRMAAGEPIDGDVSWCRQRLRALEDWPDQLDIEQAIEIETLRGWLVQYG